MKNQVKGFTLIELLIVIGIIAILATVVILTLNPAELLRQARDSTRTSDLATLKSAISLFGADVATTSPIAYGLPINTVPRTCYVSISTGGTMPSAWGNTCAGRFKDQLANTTGTSASETAKRNVDGSGWIPVNLKAISSGAPISALPVDPISPNSSSSYYAYAADGVSVGSFEVNATLESTKFASSSYNDGGDSNALYEVGTQPGLNL